VTFAETAWSFTIGPSQWNTLLSLWHKRQTTETTSAAKETRPRSSLLGSRPCLLRSFRGYEDSGKSETAFLLANNVQGHHQLVSHLWQMWKEMATAPQHAPLQSMPIPQYSWQWVSTDIVGPFPCTKRGNKCFNSDMWPYQVGWSFSYSLPRLLQTYSSMKSSADTVCQRLYTPIRALILNPHCSKKCADNWVSIVLTPHHTTPKGMDKLSVSIGRSTPCFQCMCQKTRTTGMNTYTKCSWPIGLANMTLPSAHLTIYFLEQKLGYHLIHSKLKKGRRRSWVLAKEQHWKMQSV